MRIESEDKKSFLLLDFLELEKERYPSLSISVKIENEGFSGCNKNIWLESGSLKNFLKELKSLDKKRNGFASIESMDPEEFKLKIESIDRSGHLILKYSLLKYSFLKNSYYPNYIERTVSGGFELDTSCFSEIIKVFENLNCKLDI